MKKDNETMIDIDNNEGERDPIGFICAIIIFILVCLLLLYLIGPIDTRMTTNDIENIVDDSSHVKYIKINTSDPCAQPYNVSSTFTKC